MERINLSLQEVREAVQAALRCGYDEDSIVDAIYNQQLKVGQKESDKLEKEVIIWDEISTEDLDKFEAGMGQGENALGGMNVSGPHDFPGIEI